MKIDVHMVRKALTYGVPYWFLTGVVFARAIIEHRLDFIGSAALCLVLRILWTTIAYYVCVDY